MHGPDGRLTVTFNGEIYNYQSLRRGLEASGRVFRSLCDKVWTLQVPATNGRTYSIIKSKT